jgi:cytochrome b pre-mRNA-processing protein 3
MLHMYILTVRLRYFPSQYSTIWLQHLHDHFFYEAEHRMTIFHAISAKGVRQKYLKDLYDQWRGVTAAYDEGLIRGDAVLATAVWRNVFKAREDVDWTKVALVVAFMRRGLRGLDKAQDRQIVGGLIRFASPMSEAAMVDAESEWMNKAFGPEDEETLQKYLKELEGTKRK